MSDYLMKEYYLDQDPPLHEQSLVEASTAMEAIKGNPTWEHADYFTFIGELDNQAHTEDRDGKSGCEARRITDLLAIEVMKNEVTGFDCGFVGSPADMVGKMTPFKPHWEAQYLGDGTLDIFDTPEEAAEWIRNFYDIEGETTK